MLFRLTNTDINTKLLSIWLIPSQQVVLASTALLIQWNLQIKDTLGLGFCPFKRGCPLFRGYKCIVGIQKQAFGTTKSVL